MPTQIKRGELGRPQRMSTQHPVALAADAEQKRQARLDTKQEQKGLKRKQGPEQEEESPLEVELASVPPTECQES